MNGTSVARGGGGHRRARHTIDLSSTLAPATPTSARGGRAAAQGGPQSVSGKIGGADQRTTTGVSPGAPSDAEVRRELKEAQALGVFGGGVSRGGWVFPLRPVSLILPAGTWSEDKIGFNHSLVGLDDAGRSLGQGAPLLRRRIPWPRPFGN